MNTNRGYKANIHGSLLRLLMALLLLFINGTLFAIDFEVNGIKYYTSAPTNTTVKVTGKTNNYTGAIVIPESVSYQGNTYTVTAIDEDAFWYETDITSISLPQTITLIDDDAFQGCDNLETVYITSLESWLKIAFGDSGSSPLDGAHHLFIDGKEVHDIVIPEGSTVLDDYVFNGFLGLYSVTLPNSLKALGKEFGGCSNLQLVVSKIDNPEIIGIEGDSYPFRGISPNAKLVVPRETINSYLAIPKWRDCFYEIVEGVNDGSNIISFADANVKAICVANWDTNGDGELSKDEAATVTYLGGAFYENTTITSFEELQFFVGIEDLSSAFRKCSKLKKVVIPNSVKTIGKWAFQFCDGLTGTLVIPTSVISIGESAFEGCSGFSGSLTLPSSVTSIGTRSFMGCGGFSSLKLPNSLKTIGDYAFCECSGLSGSLTISNSVTAIGWHAFDGCIGLTGSLTLPNSIAIIGNGAFYGCSGFASLTIPNSVTSIGDHAFYGCSNIDIVISQILIPFDIPSFVFKGISSEAVLQVPDGTKAEYLKYPRWTEYFKEIIEEGDNKITYSLSLSSIGNGSVLYNGSTIRNNTSIFIVDEGTSATITFSPDNGYRIASLYVNSNNVTSTISNNKYTISNISRNTTVEVIFEAIPPTTYTLSIKSTGSGSASYNGTTIRSKTTSFTVNEGTSATITFTPDNGYRIASLYVNSNNVTSGISNNKYTISNISRNTTVEVTFEAIPPTTYTFSIKATGSGSASYSSTTIRGKTTSFTVNEGTSATITFTPDNGYRIASLYVNSNNVTSSISNNKYTISNISCNTTVEVTFEAIPPTTYTLSIKATGNGSASYNSTTIRGNTTSFTVNEGMSATITFTPDNGYRIASLYVNSNNVTSGVSNNKYTISNISKNTTVEVTFEAIPVTSYTLSIKTTGGGSASYNGTTIRSKTSSFTVNEGTSVSITLTPDNGYRIKGVKENNTNVTSYVSNNKYVINSISRNTTVEVEFEAIPATTYTLSIKSVGNGSANYNGTVIRGETSAFAVSEGASATVTLYPDEGYSIKSAIVDNTDVLSDIRNNKITLQTISHDILVNIHFENKCDSIIKEFYATQELVDKELDNCRQQLDNLKKLIEKAKEIDADGFSSYEAKYNAYGIALGGIEENAKIQKQAFDSLISSYNEYGIEDLGDEYINGYAERFDYGLKKAKELLMLIHEREDDINTTYSQLNDELNNLPQTITYTMSVTSSGNGYASYGGVQVRNTTTSFTVNEGTTVTITFVPDNGYQIASVKLNNSDVTAGVSNNSYTINNIKANTILEVVFEAMPTTVIADGVNFNITSQTEQTVSVANGSYGQVLTVPATVTGYGKTWTVTGVEANALSGNTQLAAVIWNPEVAFTATVSNPNLLLYVKAERYAPSAIQNVVVNGTANSIVLTEAQSGNNFYCPQAFTAHRISFTHNYNMSTGIGESRGWETIALPFDVQTITHATKGEIVPFVNLTSGSTKKPFWLYQLTGSGFKEADAIKAYTPYIISMPNNSQYASEWLLNGSVTFSATNVTIRTTDNVQTATYGSRTFVPNYADRGANEGLYALNAVNDFVTNNSGMTEGSKFVLNMRQVHPFEAYMTSLSNARTYFDIFDDLSTDIKEEFIVHSSQFLVGDRVFDLQGRKVEHPSKKGVYIVNGKKKVIK